MAKKGGGDREIIYRLGVEMDPRTKKAFEDFGKSAMAVQKHITREAQREAKQRTDDATKAVRDQEKEKIRAAKEQAQRDKLEGFAWRQLEREKAREQAKSLAEQTKAAEKAAREKEKAIERGFKKEAQWMRIAEKAVADRAKREQAEIAHTERTYESLKKKVSKSYVEMAEGSVKAGDGVLRLASAAIKLGASGKTLAVLQKQLGTIQLYFDMYKGAVDIVLGLSKAYRAVATAATAAAAAQALSARAGAASTVNGVGSALSGVGVGASGASSAASTLRLAGLVGRAGPIGLAALAGTAIIGGIGFGVDALLGGSAFTETLGGLGWKDTGQEATKRARDRYAARRAQQARLEQKAAQRRELDAPIEEAMLAARMEVAQARGAEGFGEQRSIIEEQLGTRRTANEALESDRAAGKPVAEGDILDNQKKIVSLTEQKLALEKQVRKYRVEGMENELTGSKESLEYSQQRVRVLMDAQRTMEERWNRMSESERSEAVEAAKAVKAGTATAKQRDLLRGMGGDAVLSVEMQNLEKKQARASGIGQFHDATGFASALRTRVEDLDAASERTLKLENEIKVTVEANFEEMKALVAKVLTPELAKLKALMIHMEAREAAHSNNKDAADDVAAGGG